MVLLLPLVVALNALADQTPNLGQEMKVQRDRLAGYQWRLKTEMTVDGALRVTKLEDVHLGPGGTLVKKIVKFEKKDAPQLASTDPRKRLGPPATDAESDRYGEQAHALMMFYAQLSAERVDRWARDAETLPPDPDRPGKLRVHGRGLGRLQDDAIVYLDAKTKVPVEVEVKTTVDRLLTDIAFIRASFEAIPTPRTGVTMPFAPKKIFVNMNRGKRRVTLEMETSDYRPWP